MKIVFCSSEVFPFAKTGGLADVCGALPKALEVLGDEVIIFLPLYRCVRLSGHATARDKHGMPYSQVSRNVRICFIQEDRYFDREELYGEAGRDYPDNLERFSFFCARILDYLKILDFPADVIHCHDWQSALIPVYIKERYQRDPFFKNVRTLFTIHNLAFQGVFPPKEYCKLGLPDDKMRRKRLEHAKRINLLKAAVVYADEISTVSERYAQEIQTRKYGFGLNEVLLSRGKDVDGIVNGIDQNIWDPWTDTLIEQNYNEGNFCKLKERNKEFLQKYFNLLSNAKRPLVGFVGRLSHQKGIDLILEMLPDLMPLNIQIVIQGLGEKAYYKSLGRWAKRYPQQLALCFEFSEGLAHQIYAGCDFFLMPSTFEPCGLSQLISLRYGTIPIVSKTGGLVDTVKPFRKKDFTGNGFVVGRYTAKAFVNKVQKAVTVFRDQASFRALQLNAMQADFSWKRSAEQYQCLYKKIRGKKVYAIET
jgi:starch synthase